MRRSVLLFLSLVAIAVPAAWFSLSAPSAFAWQDKAAEKAAIPNWIWAAGAPKANQTICFRKVIEIPAKVKSVTVTAACDNVMSLFVNGQKLVEHQTWEQAFKEDITKKVTEGRNIIGIRGINQDGAAALIAKITIEGA
ncbi:MAG TPA: hypothetical protein VL096_18915, partial [Pirellulaceae bacterium]|nr:hypothetical protein [Pirellulaceae bacterium]